MDRWLAALERRLHPFMPPHFMWWLIAVQAFVVIAELSMPGSSSLLILKRSLLLEGQVWRLVTWLAVPPVTALFPAVLAFHCLYLLGNRVEQQWGPARMCAYLVVGAAAVGTTALVFDVEADTSFIPLSLFFAFAALFPDEELDMFYVLAVPARALAWISAIGVVGLFIQSEGLRCLIPLASVLNALLYFHVDLVGALRGLVSESRAFGRMRSWRASTERPVRRCATCGASDEDGSTQFRVCVCARCGVPTDFCLTHAIDHGAE